VINIVSSAPDEPKYGIFKRLVDPGMRISQIALRQWEEDSVSKEIYRLSISLYEYDDTTIS